MPEKESIVNLDDERTIESITPPVVEAHDARQTQARTAGDSTERTEEADLSTDSPDSSTLERWNESRINVYRYFATLYCFMLMGMNDAATGVSIPHKTYRPPNMFLGTDPICKMRCMNRDVYVLNVNLA